MSGPANDFRASIRWMPCLNTTSEWIPAHAAMMLAGYGDLPDSTSSQSSLAPPTNATPFGTYGFGAWAKEDGQRYWKVAKPNAAVYQQQNAAVIFFNGPHPIPPYGQGGRDGWGSCTQDLPAIAIHNYEESMLMPGLPCTVLPDHWDVWPGGSMFSCMGHDQGDIIKPSSRPEHAVWVTHGRNRIVPLWNQGYLDSSLSVPSLGHFTPKGSIFTSGAGGPGANGFGDVPYSSSGAAPGGSASFGSGYFYIPAHRSGVYNLSFSATAWFAASVPRGTLLTLAIEVWWPLTDDGLVALVNSQGRPMGYQGVPQIFRVQRTQQIESDVAYGVSGVVAKENMAITMPTYIPEWGVIICKNYSAHTVEMTYPTMGVASLGRRDYPVATDIDEH